MDKGFYKRILGIALPVTVQNMISYSVNMLDTLMLGQLGEQVLSAAGLAGQIFFMYGLLINGIGSGGSVLCSQYYGKGDMENLRRVVAILLKLRVGAGLLFTAVLIGCPRFIMRIFTPDGEVIRLGAEYLRTIAVSYIFYAVTSTILISLRSVRDVKLSMRVYIISLLVNALANYMLIFGKLGAPKLGIAGAAWGTVIARGVEVVLAICYLRFYEKVLAFRKWMLTSFHKELFRDLMKYGLPVIAGEFLWGLGVTVHSVILGHMGSAAVAANSICSVLHQFMLSFVQGVASSSAVIIGNFVGAGKIAYARKASRSLVKVFIICGFLTGLLMYGLSIPFFRFYKLEADSMLLAKQFMTVYIIFTAFRAMVSPILTGIFWGGGDTKFSAQADMGFLWALIPIGAAAAFIFRIHPALVLTILRLESPLKLAVALERVRGTKWIKPLTRSV